MMTVTEIDTIKASITSPRLLEVAFMDLIQAVAQHMLVVRTIEDSILTLDRLRQAIEKANQP